MNDRLKNQYQSIGDIAGYIREKGWGESNAGNISVNVTDLLASAELAEMNRSVFFKLDNALPALAQHVFMITTGGSRMRLIRKKPKKHVCLIALNDTGSKYRLLYPGKVSDVAAPTSEMPAHLTVQDFLVRSGSPARAVLHAHVTETIAFTHHPKFKSEKTVNDLLWSIQPETIMLIPDGVGFVPFRKPGSYEMAKETVAQLENHRAVIWEKHGCLTTGETLDEAFDQMELIAKSIEIYFQCRDAGYNPEGLTKSQMDTIRNSM